MKNKSYFESIIMIGKVYNLFLELLKNELHSLKIRDINNTQCMILYNLGKKYVTVGELNEKYYIGTNVNYNLINMVKKGYLIKEPNLHDFRTMNVKLSEKGLELHVKLDKLFNIHIHELKQGGYDESFGMLCKGLDCMEEFWINMLHSIKV